MRVISTRDIFGAARDFIDGSPENWDGGYGGDFSDLSDGVDGVSLLEDGSAPRLTQVEDDLSFTAQPTPPPVRKALTKGRRVAH